MRCPICNKLIRKHKKRAVFQYRYLNHYNNWHLTRRLYSEDEAKFQFEGSAKYEKHAGPFLVENCNV